ncbi:MAG: sugar transferase [Crocinitomicaceae bacterium]|nr:sugar transferase [Crocinitomicaceae bacterium]
MIKLLFIFFDYVAALVAWVLFFHFRKEEIEGSEVIYTNAFYWGIAVIPICWLLFYALWGEYNDVLRKYRLSVLTKTVVQSIIGVTLIFFILLLNDEVINYNQYYSLFFYLLGTHFVLTFLPRFTMTSMIVSQVHRGKIGFKTLVIGGNQKSLEIYEELTHAKKSAGNKFIGFVNINGSDTLLEKYMPRLGKIDDIHTIMHNEKVDEVIIALETADHGKIKPILTELLGYPVVIKVIPDIFDILSGSLKTTSIFGTLLLEIKDNIMPVWQQVLKRGMDILFSLIAMILLLPVYMILAISVKMSSKGPIFFTQERVGRHGKPFKIIKFRTMYVGAEKNGPQLSSSNDSRITKVGKFLRKSRLDEFPQFWNVFIGEMSLVGPRPERQYFIDQIMQREKQYIHLNKVRPGITSWGQVKFGYAENIEQMLQRMKYDLLYVRNMSLALDFKIMLYTVMIILKGKGK